MLGHSVAIDRRITLYYIVRAMTDEPPSPETQHAFGRGLRLGVFSRKGGKCRHVAWSFMMAPWFERGDDLVEAAPLIACHRAIVKPLSATRWEAFNFQPQAIKEIDLPREVGARLGVTDSNRTLAGAGRLALAAAERSRNPVWRGAPSTFKLRIIFLNAFAKRRGGRSMCRHRLRITTPTILE